MSVTYDKFMSIIGIAFHNDGKRWKYECRAVLLRCCGIKSLLLAPAKPSSWRIEIDKIIDAELISWIF